MRSVFGAHVAGDSIDYQNGEVLIGCYASKNQIQVWDYNKFTMKESITWTTNSEKDKVAYVYTAAYAYGLRISLAISSRTLSWLAHAG